MMMAERTVTALRAWKDGLLTANEASEIAGVDSEAELHSASRAAEAEVASLFNRWDFVRPVPARPTPPSEPTGQEDGAFICSRR